MGRGKIIVVLRTNKLVTRGAYLERGKSNNDSEKGIFWQYMIIILNLMDY
jgi:hypothetical protein